jgi:dienelactone hydrolase
VLFGGSDTVRAFAHRASGYTPWRIASIGPGARAARPVVIYLHGRIVEVQGPRALSPEFGEYAWQAIVDSLRASDFTVIADLRPASTDPDEYAARVASQVDSILKTGVAPSRLAVVGFSKGAGIAIRASARLRRTDLTFVFMGACPPDQPYTSVVAGRVLSVYEASDSLGQSCEKLLSAALPGSRHDERRIDTGRKHGAFYQPRLEWITPVREWIRGR